MDGRVDLACGYEMKKRSWPNLIFHENDHSTISFSTIALYSSNPPSNE